MPPTPKKPARSKKTATAAKPAKPAKPAKKRSTAGAKRTKPKKERTVLQIVSAALDDLKAIDATFLDVRHLTTLTDTMVIASGRSDRHVRAIGAEVVGQCKKAGFRPIGVEGQQGGEWVLVDLADVVVHVMLPRVREFYNLEKLWDISARDEAAEANA